MTLKRREKKKRQLNSINQTQGIGEAVEAGAGLHHFCDFNGVQPLSPASPSQRRQANVFAEHFQEEAPLGGLVGCRRPYCQRDPRLEALMRALRDGAAFGVFILILIVTILALAPQP